MRIYIIFVLVLLLAGCNNENSQVPSNAAEAPEVTTNFLEFALSRDEETTLLETDPKVSKAFWKERDKEIDAILEHVSTGAFDKPSEKLEAMVSVDQSLRHLYTVLQKNASHFASEEEVELVKNGLGERIARVDTFNTVQLKQMLQSRSWFRDDRDGQNAGQNAWLIVQHADNDPDFQRMVLPMMEAQLGSPGVSKQNYAYLYDRVAGKDGHPQRYGTQGRCTAPQVWEPNEIADPDNIDLRRAEVGLPPMDDYIALFINICIDGN